MYSMGGSPLLEPAYIAGDPPMISRGNRGGIHPYNNVKTHGICGVLNPTKRVFIPSTIFFPIGNRHSIPHGVWCLSPPSLTGDGPIAYTRTTNNTQYTMKLKLRLNSTKHVYNPQFKTFHVTMEHLYGEPSPVKELERMGALPIHITNPVTGVTVVFEWVTRNVHCNVYKALHVTSPHKPAVHYRLLVWENAATMRARYSAEIDLYGTFILHATDPAAINA